MVKFKRILKKDLLKPFSDDKTGTITYVIRCMYVIFFGTIIKSDKALIIFYNNPSSEKL